MESLTPQEIAQIVKESIPNYAHANADITEEATLKDLGLDSLDKIEISMELEDRLGITLDDDEIADVETVKDLIEVVEPKC
jgi:acyl carrier protein